MTKIKTHTHRDSVSAIAKVARTELEKISRSGENLTLFASQDDEQHDVVLPAEVVRLLMEMLDHLALHKHVSIVASDYELTTQQVADILRVSRPFVTKLIDNGELSASMVGTHRRIRYDDVVEYKAKIDEARSRSLDDLALQSQELGLY